jgi:hypothetical protein
MFAPAVAAVVRTAVVGWLGKIAADPINFC